MTIGTPADTNSCAEPTPLTNRRCGDEIAPAHRMTSLLAITRYFDALEDAATSTPEARGVSLSDEKMILSTVVFVVTVKLGLLRTSGVR